MKRYTDRLGCLLVVGLAATLSDVAHAYIGPGAGLGAIGTVIAFVGALLLAIVGFVWYPIKRLLRKKKTPELKKERQGESVARPEPDTNKPYAR
jgi:hypothetical protein